MSRKQVQRAEQVQQNAKTSDKDNMILTAGAFRSSPFPPPAEMEAYEKLRPGFMDVLVRAYSDQVHTRLEAEAKIVDAQIQLSHRGQIFAFVLLILILVSGIVLICLGLDVKGFVLILGAAVSIAALFITGRKRHDDDANKNTGDDVWPK